MLYRNAVRVAEKEARWTFMKFLPLFLLLLVVLGGIAFGTRSLGLWGGTVVERKIFENSYQRSESLKAEVAMNRAVITEIEKKLLNQSLDTATRYNLEAQLSAARIRISTAEAKQ